MLRIPSDEDVTEFTVDLSSSSITGAIDASDPTNTVLSVRVECRQARIIPLHSETDEERNAREQQQDFLTRERCHAEIFNLPLQISDWRELDGKRFSADFARDDVHPIMPDNPGNFYFATEHHVTNNNRLSFVRRRGNVFHLRWHFDAEESEYDVMPNVEIDADVPFRNLRVYFEDPALRSLDAARRLIFAIAKESDLGAPALQGDNWVVFPLRSNAE